MKGTTPCFRKELQFQRGLRCFYIGKSNSSQQKSSRLTRATFFHMTCDTPSTVPAVQREQTISPEKYLYINTTMKL